MNFNSIITRVTLIFLVAFLFLLGLFSFFLKYEEKEREEKAISHHKSITMFLHRVKMPESKVIAYLEKTDFTEIENPKEVMNFGKEIFRERGFDTFEYKNELYLLFKTPFFRTLFKDNQKYEKNYFSYVFLFVSFAFLILLYMWLLKSLSPLKKLKDDISKFSKGDLSINCKSHKKDEIADVSNEFDNAVKKIKLLLESRQLFLRTVMHELKTPIAKGRIVSELVKEEKQKNRMINIFESLDFLINDFAKIEQIISRNYKLEKKEILFSDILDNSMFMLMLEKKEQVSKKLDKKKKIKVDFDLMSLVFKNLLDNALKYSSDKKVLVLQNNKEIVFVSNGNKLEKDFEEYFEPFHNTVKSKSHGMGLGLYIVKSILDIHEFDFKYEFSNNQNFFKIIY